jgi:hypothetical protein
MYVYVFKTRLEIADELNIDRKTLYEKLKDAPFKLPKGLVRPVFQQAIYDFFGIYPPGWEDFPS